MEPPFDTIPGVVSTTSGYAGGNVVNPTYEQVASGVTGHAEVVQVVFDPGKVSYEQLLEVFWRNIDPLDGAGQFCDRGRQYRTAIYYEGDVPDQWKEYYKVNVDFFEDLGSPGGASKVGKIGKDHPLVAALPPQATEE